MILTVDGQRKQRKTGTNDLDKAVEMLAEWRAEEKAGVAETGSKMRYEQMRDTYVQQGGKTVQTGVLRDLDAFFKGIYVNAITVKKLDRFRAWRESLDQVLEYKAETLEKEIALRMMKGGRKVSPDQKEKIKQEATKWVENGVQATTDKRLRILRAMFGFLAKRGMLHKNDIPSFPIKGAAVDNKNRTFLGESDLRNLLKKLDGVFHPFVKFLYATGMRSGQASKLTWDMVDKNCTQLHVLGELTKNGEDFVLPLVYQNGKPIFDFVKDMKSMARTPHQPIFETTDFRSQWRQACHELGLGVFNKETRAYRGAKPHDFRRTACRNMVIAGIPQPVAMAISGHKTDSIFRRYAIMDKSAVQQAFETLQAK